MERVRFFIIACSLALLVAGCGGGSDNAGSAAKIGVAETTGSVEGSLPRWVESELAAAPGGFVSLTDPPERLRAAAEACDNVGVWPILVGEPGSADTMLCSPIILEDHPRIAPESPGDLYDGGEIDGLLTLSIMSLTDEEKAEIRAGDPRARAILERTESLSRDELMRLHGFRVER